MSARILSFVNLKGGVGKTALAVNVGVSLAAELGKKVLLIDLDPQSNASLWLLGQKEWVKIVNHHKTKTVYGILCHHTPVSQCIVKSPVLDEEGHAVAQKLDLIPATIHLMNFEEQHSTPEGEAAYYVRFYQEIQVLRAQYDFMFLDCPPNVFKTTKCGIFASDYVIVPCNTDSLSWIGLQLLAQKIRSFVNRTSWEFEETRPGEKPPLISALVLNNVQTTASTVLNKAVERLETRLSNLKKRDLVRDDAELFAARIRQAAAFQKGSFEFRPLLFCQQPNKSLLSDYTNLATLLVDRFGGSYGQDT